MDEACRKPLRLDALNVTDVLQCDRPNGHGGRHASYEHGCQAKFSFETRAHAPLGDVQCELPNDHRGPHRATDATDVSWTLQWANPDPED